MRITKVQDISVGDHITYMAETGRKIVCVSKIDPQSNHCITGTKVFDECLLTDPCSNAIIINDLFDCPSDEVFTTYNEIKLLYPEEFI